MQWERGGKPRVLRTYERLHANKIGAHWIWIALERIAEGEPEIEVLRDYGYAPEVPNAEITGRTPAQNEADVAYGAQVDCCVRGRVNEP